MNTNSTEHTKAPWRIIDIAFYQAGLKWVAYVFAGRDLVARFYGETEEEATNAANAAIKAVNSHEALVALLARAAMHVPSSNPLHAEISEALRLATQPA